MSPRTNDLAPSFGLPGVGCATASFAQEPVDQELEAASEDFMRDESGVNDITAPSIKQILKDFSSFSPVPLDIIAENPRDAVYDNRLQTRTLAPLSPMDSC